MGSRGKLRDPLLWHELIVDSRETLTMISSLKSPPGPEVGGIDKLDTDSKLFEVNLG